MRGQRLVEVELTGVVIAVVVKWRSQRNIVVFLGVDVTWLLLLPTRRHRLAAPPGLARDCLLPFNLREHVGSLSHLTSNNDVLRRAYVAPVLRNFATLIGPSLRLLFSRIFFNILNTGLDQLGGLSVNSPSIVQFCC